MTTAEFTEVRRGILDYLKRQVVGPVDGETETLYDLPHRRYLSGTLYPANASTEEVEETDEADGPGGSIGEELNDEPVRLANQWLPSSIGVSFYLSGPGKLTCHVWGACYETQMEDRRRSWLRRPIAERDQPERVTLEASSADSRTPVLDGRACLSVRWRPMPEGHLVTVSLLNAQEQAKPHPINPDLTLHQVGFCCEAVDGAILEYPSVDFLSDDPEDQELRLLYRHAKTFAIGHGCAADWPHNPAPIVEAVWTALVPEYEVPPVTHGGDDTHEALCIAHLASEDLDQEELRGQLKAFAQPYRDWIGGLSRSVYELAKPLRPAAEIVLKRLEETMGRIDEGIETVTSDPRVLRAFRLANRAILMQMRHSKDDLGGTRRVADSVVPQDIDYDSLTDYRWRPFQLAFILSVLPSVEDGSNDYRSVVDLIWFPTGGGKTEAYLGVAAFEIFLRRLRHGDRGAGTAVITRYTLRLLTTQQFQRASALACACELIRRSNKADMGGEPIGIGLWVGKKVSPNDRVAAVELFKEVLKDPQPKNPFQLESCPWCGTEIVPPRQVDDVSRYGIEAGSGIFKFFCPSTVCAFHEGLPVAVVDDELYAHPPTILIATVDKFAQLAWQAGGSAFFGNKGRYLPPTLIIQDELHLLSGPLGTIVGIYESAVELLCCLGEMTPKVIASTATIRRAPEQVAGLFGSEVRLFPPTGLDARDSYFSREDREEPGRLYVGVMAQSHTTSTTTVSLASVLLQAPVELELEHNNLDAYWTLVAYHNSLRELGRTITQAHDDIPSRMEAAAPDNGSRRGLDSDNVVELTSNVSGQRLPGILRRLEKDNSDSDEVSLLACTNMLSVGVDVSRLALMLVNGQPKSTSEYIQATSRVGRSSVPGLVVTMLSVIRPRDRSHYEDFIPYHSALYRRVEPTSVTPFSLPSRERALHAALVVAVRHGAGLSAADAAGDFDPGRDDIRKIIVRLKERVSKVDPLEAPDTVRHLDRRVREWSERAAAARASSESLWYNGVKQQRSLLENFGPVPSPPWATLHSMRKVDGQCPIWVLGESRSG